MFFLKQERRSRKLRLRLRSGDTGLGKLRLLGIAPELVNVERSMATRKPKPATISILPSTLNGMVVGGTQQLSWQVLDAAGRPITGISVTFLSSNSSIATVSATGLVRALAPGSFSIVASVRNVQTNVPGTVVAAAPAPVASVTVAPDISQGAVGSTQQFTATLRDAAGNILVGRTMVWASATPSYATVNAVGLVTLLAPGITAISATAEGVTGAATLTVVAAAPVVVTVDVVPSVFSGEVGDQFQLVAQPKDASANVISGKIITWASSSGVASVNTTGLVTLLTPGSVVITATVDAINGTSNGTSVAAVVPVSTVTVTPTSFSVNPGATQALTVVLRDSSGNILTGRTIAYASSNTSVATVDTAGIVTGVATGTAVITVTSEGKTGTSNATVAQVPVATVAVSPPNFTISVGGTQQLIATPKDAAGNTLTGRVITWGSSDVTKLTVSSSGLVTAVASGSATITASCETKTGTSSGTVAVVTYSPVNARSNVLYVPEPNPAGSVVQFPTFRDSAYPSLSFAQTVTLTSAQGFSNLQTEINNAAVRAGHTLINLNDGFVAIGNLNLPQHTGAYKTIVRRTTLPTAEGFQCAPASMSTAPKIITNNVAPAIATAARANGYRFVGIEITAQGAAGAYNYGLVRVGGDEITALTDMADDIIFDRCYIHAGSVMVQHGVAANGHYVAVVDCFFAEIKWSGTETHDIAIWSGTGPLKVVGNAFSAASIGVLSGGAQPKVPGTIPADFEIRRNFFDKDLSLLGQGYVLKNLLE